MYIYIYVNVYVYVYIMLDPLDATAEREMYTLYFYIHSLELERVFH